MVKLLVSKAEIQAKTGLTLIFSFFVLFLVDVFVVYLANQLFPADVVLGTYSISLGWALHHSMARLALINMFVIPLVYYHEWKRGSNYSPKEWMLVYFVVNTLAIWGITRFAEAIGLGISHWWVALLLAAALDWAQGIAMMGLGKLLPRS